MLRLGPRRAGAYRGPGLFDPTSLLPRHLRAGPVARVLQRRGAATIALGADRRRSERTEVALEGVEVDDVDHRLPVVLGEVGAQVSGAGGTAEGALQGVEVQDFNACA